MTSAFDLLVPPPPPEVPSYRWGTITALSPLTVQLDGDAIPLPIAPTCLAVPKVGGRAYCQIFRRQVVILGVRASGNDHDWTPVAITNTTDFGLYTAGQDLRIRRDGDEVTFQGELTTKTAGVPSSGSGTVVGTVPTWARTNSGRANYASPRLSASTNNSWMMRVSDANGDFTAERFGPGTATVGVWLPFFVTWRVG